MALATMVVTLMMPFGPATVAAAATQTPPVTITLGAWTITSLPEGGLFRCLMVQGAPATGAMFVGVDEKGAVLVGFDHPPRPEPGREWPSLAIVIDGAPVRLTVPRARSVSETAVVYLGLYDAPSPRGGGRHLKRGQRLDFREGAFAKSFDLGGFAEGVASLRTCDRIERGRDKLGRIARPG
ncbi:hypothetical protein [Aureimonas psammosilenae]|uniref:hypothetical protein n=1 Tax=Aureimonas psammosilenae TaxID=2495496 RepID=UPI0012613601|nr:hypothetical protein [Aureimonas psammosilenae]